MPPTRPTSLFRLGDLLDQHDLLLELVVGGDEARRRRVSGVHAIEIDRPSRWLAPDWVMLSTGVRLVGDAEAQRALPGELLGAGVAALGIGLDLGFASVPEPLLESARELGLPVFSVPLQTPFREIEGFVQRALLSSEMRVLQRLSSMQRYLVDALASAEPGSAVVRRLARLLESSVAVLRADGTVEEATGELPGGLGGLLDDPAAGVRELERDGWRIVVAPVAPDAADPDGRWLALAARGRELHDHRLVRPVLQAAAPLLAAVGRLEQTGLRQDRELRRLLLSDLLAGEGDPQSLRARATACGIDLRQPTAVIAVVAGPGSPQPVPLDRIERQVDERLAATGVARLVTVDRGRVLALVPAVGGDLPDALLDRLAADGDVAIGVGRSGVGAAAVARSGTDAHVVADTLAVPARDGREQRAANGPTSAPAPSADGDRRWRRYVDVDLPSLVVGEVAPAAIAPQVAQVLAAIDARPGLREALLAYFAHDLDAAAAAASLHLHPNSLRYRLGRLADTLGSSLRDPTTIATLVLALAAEQRSAGDRPD